MPLRKRGVLLLEKSLFIKRIILIFLVFFVFSFSAFAENCTIDKAGWVDSKGNVLQSAREGETVYLGASFLGCEGKKVLFSILEFDGYDSNGLPQGENIKEIDGGYVPNNGIVVVPWEAKYVEDQPDENGNDPEYIFVVGIVENNVVVNYKTALNLLPVLPSKESKEEKKEEKIEIVDLCGNGQCDYGEEETCPSDCVDYNTENLQKIGLFVLFGFIVILLIIVFFAMFRYLKKKKIQPPPVASQKNVQNGVNAQSSIISEEVNSKLNNLSPMPNEVSSEKNIGPENREDSSGYQEKYGSSQDELKFKDNAP